MVGLAFRRLSAALDARLPAAGRFSLVGEVPDSTLAKEYVHDGDPLTNRFFPFNLRTKSRIFGTYREAAVLRLPPQLKSPEESQDGIGQYSYP